MWGNCVEILANILFYGALILAIFHKKKRKLWIVCLALAGAVSLYTAFVPIENLFYSFPSAEAVAKYACKGEVIEILDGKESSLILYAEKPGTVSYMLSNKTEQGYKIGTYWNIRRHSRLISNPPAPIQIYESANAVDKYIYVFGIIEGRDVSINDTQGNDFLLFEESSTHTGVELTSFEAFCILSDAEDTDYKITVNSTEKSIDLKPE